MSARELLKQSDYELYIFSLFLPACLRPGAWAVLALVAELASIHTKAYEPLARAMRLAWWREQLEAMYAGEPPRRHDILEALAPWVAQQPKQEWDRLIEAYGRQMEGDAAAGGDTVAPWLHLLAALGGAYTKDYEAREAWGMRMATGILRQSENLKKSDCIFNSPTCSVIPACAGISLSTSAGCDRDSRFRRNDDKGMCKLYNSLKKVSGNNLNATLFRLTYILYDLRAEEQKENKNNSMEMKASGLAGLFPLRFWWRVLLTKW